MVAMHRPPLLLKPQSYRHSLPCLRNRNICFPFSPSNTIEFSSLHIPSRKPFFFFFCSSSSWSPLSSMDTPPQGYRRNVGICLINPSKKIFTASRLDIPGAWQMPQGGIDDGESPRTAAMRELREETGVTSAEVVSEVPYWLTYDFPPEVREKLKKQWGSDWKGQAQKWFLLKFMGNDDEINLMGDGTEKAEFGEWSWMTPQQVTEHAVDFKRSVYEEVLKAFDPYLKSD